MTDAANPHLAAGEVRLGPPPGSARLTTVLVHGRDQDDALMRDVAARLALDDVAHVLPLAAGRSWYPGRYFDPRDTLQPHLGWSLAAIDRAIAGAGVPDDRLLLGGFSQGACLIAEYIARAGPRRFAGVAVLTGALLGSPDERAVGELAPGLPMAFVSARGDAWIPIDDARQTAERFRRAGARVTFDELDDPVHHVSDRAVAALRGLLEI
jgi:phospholipase/carboxylesterase